MTDWQDSIQTFGSGFVAYRLMVQGWPHEWVTDPRITHNSGGTRITYPGLSYEGLRIEERMILREAWPECSGITARIVPADANEDTLNSFTRDPRVVATLSIPLDFDVNAWTTQPELPLDEVYHLGSEAVLTTEGESVDGDQVIARGYLDTEAQDHATVEGGKANPVSVYNWPPTMEGRRAYLYAYGPNDDPDSDGRVIWRGVVKRPPAMDSDGISWNIEIGPITDRFDQNLGASDEIEYRLRGIYHSASCPMVIGVTTDYNTATPTMPITRVWGFYETQDNFANAVSAALATSLLDATDNAALLEKIVCDYTRVPGRYSFYIRTIGYTSYDDWPLIVRVMDALDGSCWVGSPGDPQLNGEPIYSGEAFYSAGNANGEWFFEGLPVAPYAYPLPAARTLVRGPIYTGDDSWPVIGRVLGTYKQDDDTWPDNRVYLQSVEGLEVGDVLTVKNGDSNRQMRIIAVEPDSGDRYIEVELIGTGGNGLYISSDSKIVPLRVYGENSNWADFIEEIKTAATGANLGKTPWITDGDVDTTNWASYWLDLPFHDYWRHRSYRFAKQVRVRNAFAPELQMTGWMARIALDGRLDVAPMPFISAQRAASRTITDDDILLPSDEIVGMWPTWVAQGDGLVNIAKIRLGYDPVEDDFADSGDYTVRIPQSIAEHKSGDRASTTIEVRSESASPIKSFSAFGLGTFRFQPATVTAEEVVDMIMPYLRATATDYATVTLAVPFTFFDVLVGDIVSVTSAYLPNGFGGRGITSKKAIVLGRTWNLDPGQDEMGMLTLWFARDSGRVSGYAPTGRIGSRSHLGSNLWSVSFSAGNGRNLGWSESDDGLVLGHFAADDAVQFVQVDTLTPTIVVGTLVSMVDADTCTVQLEESWTPGGDAWNMRFLYNKSEGFTLPLQERQAAYCWIADEYREYLDNNFENYPTAREAI